MNTPLINIISTQRYLDFDIVTTKEFIVIQVKAGGNLIQVLTDVYDLDIWSNKVVRLDFSDNLIEIRKDENGLSFPIVNLLSSEQTKRKIDLINELKR